MVKKLLLLFLCITNSMYSQNTVGNISITNDAYDAFTLFTIHKKTYLINNCGNVINEWTSEFTPGNAVYLLPNGNLLRAGKKDGLSQINFGGTGGVVELFDWDGNLLWQYEHNTDDYRQHHDVYPMPNGNILILAATIMTEAEAVQAGRDPNFIIDNKIYNEQIFEVEPTGTNGINVIWEWNIKDHLIQEFDNNKDNFGVVADHPEKLDFNFLGYRNGDANWLHVNSIQYNEVLDQIVISSRHMNEIWVIDHSTTTAEASSDTGGTYGKGGDFLYRWGNPLAYDHGTIDDQKLFGQHYPHVIPEGTPDAGKIILFNNGINRTPLFSQVDIINPPVTSPGVYDYTIGEAYGPEAPDYSYSDTTNDPSDFFSSFISGAQRLPNGNILICEGREGRFFEINSNDDIVWEYVNPVNNVDGGIANQTEVAVNNLTFRAIKYARTYDAFVGRSITAGSPIEGNPDLSPCNNILGTSNVVVDYLKIYPNPVVDELTIDIAKNIDKIEYYTISGKKIGESKNTKIIDFSNTKPGIYILKIYTEKSVIFKKVIKK